MLFWIQIISSSKGFLTLAVLTNSLSHSYSFRRLASKESGYVPAAYIKEIEPKIFRKPVIEKAVVKETVKVKRKKLKKIRIEKNGKERVAGKRAKRASSILHKKSKRNPLRFSIFVLTHL